MRFKIERTRSAGGHGEAVYLRGVCLRGWDCKSVPLDTGVPHGHDEFEPAAPPHDRGYEAAQLVPADAVVICLRRRELQPSFRHPTSSALSRCVRTNCA